MVFLTTFSIGILVAQMRSASSCVASAILIAVAFASAAVVSGSFPVWALALSVLGYNAALCTHLAMSLVLQGSRKTA